jgi:tripartite-type tricarboxylate transporter receptor subunit TctC
MMLFRSLFTVTAALVLATGSAAAQSDFPTKPINMYISFSVKGSSGLVGALLGAKMEEKLGQPIVLKGHKPGKSGNIAGVPRPGLLVNSRVGLCRSTSCLVNGRPRSVPVFWRT